MKLYIVGAVSSGKSTLAKILSSKLGIPSLSLDEAVHVSDKSSSSGNRKRSLEERNSIFQSFIEQPEWIMEDVGRPCFEEGFERADIIILLDISSKIRDVRIFKRWVKQKLGIEKCIYRPSIKMLFRMFQWSRDYDTGKDNLKKRLVPYKGKIIKLSDNRDINNMIQCFSRE